MTRTVELRLQQPLSERQERRLAVELEAAARRVIGGNLRTLSIDSDRWLRQHAERP